MICFTSLVLSLCYISTSYVMSSEHAPPSKLLEWSNSEKKKKPWCELNKMWTHHLPNWLDWLIDWAWPVIQLINKKDWPPVYTVQLVLIHFVLVGSLICIRWTRQPFLVGLRTYIFASSLLNFIISLEMSFYKIGLRVRIQFLTYNGANSY